jgi:hypothetical protein
MGGGDVRSTRKNTKSEKPEKPPARRQSVREAGPSRSLDVTPDERHRLIAEAAYHRAEKRGFTGGDPLHDWLEAEAQVENELQNGWTSRG